MKNMILAGLCALAIPFTAQAQEPNFGIIIGDGNSEFSIDFGFHAGDDGFVIWNEEVYVPTRRMCGVENVWIEVRGGDVEINSLAIVGRRGRVQDIPVRQYFRNGSASNLKRVRLNGGCIAGFKIDADTLHSWRGNRARVTLMGERLGRHGRYQAVELGSTRVDSYGDRREWNDRWGRDGDEDRRPRRDGKVQFCINGICFEN